MAKALVDDWQVNGVLAVFSGNPIDLQASATSLNTPSNRQTPNVVGSWNVTGNIAPNGTWLDTSAFALPTGVAFGNVGRNQFYGPGGNNLDLSVFRTFPMGGQKRLEARIEVGNVFNSLVPANPQGSFTSAAFGQVTGIAGGTALTNANYPERQARLALRFSF